MDYNNYYIYIIVEEASRIISFPIISNYYYYFER